MSCSTKFLPPHQEWCFSQLIIPTKHSGTGWEKASLHVTGAQSPFEPPANRKVAASRKCGRKGICVEDDKERRSLGRRWGDRHAGDMQPRDVSQLDAVTRMYWLRGDEATCRPRCHDCSQGCCRDCCSPIENLNTHLLHANPPASTSDFVLS